MVYQGSKNRLAKYIVPILQNYIDENKIKTYIEPFVGCNVIDKIRCKSRIGSDSNEDLIALLKYVQRDNSLSIAPQECSFEHYAEVRADKNNLKYQRSTGL
ncbi:DNA adenine methylase [Leyella stercorea]|uniref:DNA adenine methylase n=1 Tax=Leyella stercorea TaxID=363265 RepID=UPI0034E9609A